MSANPKEKVPVTTICFALAALGLYLRAPSALQNAQLVGEDGTAFFVDQFGHALPQLFAPIQGYLVVMPRLVAWIGSFFSTLQVPFVYILAATLLDAISIAYFCHRARRLFHPYASLAVILLLPLLNGEIIGILTNSQWFTQLAVVAASLLPKVDDAPRSWKAQMVQVAALLVISLTGPFAILCSMVYISLLLSYLAARLLHLERLRRMLADYLQSLDKLAVAVVTICGLILIAFAYRRGVVPLHEPASIVADFFGIVAGYSLQAHLFGIVVMERTNFYFVQGALFVLALVGPDPRVRLGCLVLLGYGWFCLVVGYLKMSALGMSAEAIGFADRYMFNVSLFEWLVAWRIASDWLFGGRITSTCILVGAMAGLGIAHPQRLRNFALPDFDWPLYARKIDAGEAVNMPINPIPWRMHIPARQTHE